MNNQAINSSIVSINTDHEIPSEEEKTKEILGMDKIKVNNSAIKLNCRCLKCDRDLNQVEVFKGLVRSYSYSTTKCNKCGTQIQPK